jgi:hypothetical protein
LYWDINTQHNSLFKVVGCFSLTRMSNKTWKQNPPIPLNCLPSHTVNVLPSIHTLYSDTPLNPFLILLNTTNKYSYQYSHATSFNLTTSQTTFLSCQSIQHCHTSHYLLITLTNHPFTSLHHLTSISLHYSRWHLFLFPCTNALNMIPDSLSVSVFIDLIYQTIVHMPEEQNQCFISVGCRSV